MPGILDNFIQSMSQNPYIQGAKQLAGNIGQGVNTAEQGISSSANTVGKAVGNTPIANLPNSPTISQSANFLTAGKQGVGNKILSGTTTPQDVQETLPLIFGGLKTGEGEELPPGKTITRISLKPSVYGAGREENVQNTVNNHVPGSTATEQYKNLQPTMDKFGQQITEIMAKNPKTASLDQIMKDYDTNLNKEGIYRNTKLTKDAVQKEARQYVSDLYNNAVGAPGGIEPTKIDDVTLYGLKQSVNQDAKSVFRKIDNGTSLTDREKVILAARQTIDDSLSSLHPDVKDLTTKQSHLYDAAESLHKGRDTEIDASTKEEAANAGVPTWLRGIKTAYGKQPWLLRQAENVGIGALGFNEMKSLPGQIGATGGAVKGLMDNKTQVSQKTDNQQPAYTAINPKDAGIMDKNDYGAQSGELQSEYESNKLNDPNAANAALAKKAKLDATFNSQNDVRTSLGNYNHITTLANGTIDALNNAPASILNSNASFEKMLTATSGNYANFAAQLKALSNATGYDLSQAKTPEDLKKAIDAAIKIEKAKVTGAQSVFNNGASMNTSPAPSTDLPPTQVPQAPVNWQQNDPKVQAVLNGGQGGGLPPFNQLFRE